MIDKAAFLLCFATAFLNIALDCRVCADCREDPSIQALWLQEEWSPDTVLRTTVHSINDTDLTCRQNSPRALLQVEEVFRGDVSVGDLLPVFYDTDTGYDTYDIPQDLVNAGNDGFVAFLRTNNGECSVPVYSLNECLFEATKPWSDVGQADKEFLRDSDSDSDSDLDSDSSSALARGPHLSVCALVLVAVWHSIQS